MNSKINLDSVFNSINIDIIKKNDTNDNLKQSQEQFSYSMIIDKKKPSKNKSPNTKDKKKAINVEQQKIINWVDDSKVTSCYTCETEFTFFTRRHHCRSCGKIFCHKCSGKFTEIPKEIDSCVENTSSWKILPTFSNAVRVCNRCYDLINEKKKITDLIKIFMLIDFTVKDYSVIGCVCKEWRTISLNYLSNFRKLQYTMPDYRFNNNEKKMLWDNRFLIQSHSLYEVAFLKSIDWKTISKNKSDEVINLIYNKKKNCNCWNMMCSRLCKQKLTEENILYLIHSKIDNFLINKYILQELTHVNNSIIICFLPNLINSIKWALDKDEPLIVKFLINRAKKSYRMANFIIWELTTHMKDPEYEKMYTNIRTLIYASLKPNIREHLKKSFQFTNRLPSVISDKCSTGNNIDNIILSIKPELKCIGINYNNIVVKSSFSKPTIAELLCTKVNKKTNTASSFKIMYKREDIRIDLIITNIIKIMDYILKKEEKLNLFVSTYNVLPIDIKKGFIEIIDDAKTLYEIQKMGFTIQNWIIENNPDTKINDLRKRFTLSCAAYCVISYLLGIGDRHLDNIMITKDGYLFHIDFSYILGRDAKFMAPEIRITPDMIDAMGGPTSKNYSLFKEICTRAYNCLRRHSNLFFILLSSLDSIKPEIQKGKYNYDYIKKQVISRFIPGENYNQAKLIFNTKVNRKRSSSYSEIIIDFCHKNAQENGIINQFSNISKGMIGYLWSGSGEHT